MEGSTLEGDRALPEARGPILSKCKQATQCLDKGGIMKRIRWKWRHGRKVAVGALCFIAFLGLMDINGWGEDWRLYTQSEDGTRYYYDATRVTKVSAGVLRFWGKALLSPEAAKRFVKIDPKFTGSDHIISFIEMNCTERKRRPLWITNFDKNGVAIENIELTLGESEWEFVLPGSVQEDILDALCVKGKSE